MPKAVRTKARQNSARRPKRAPSAKRGQISSEEAIRAGEQIALAAFASGLKLAAAFGTVAAKTAGLALASMASGADRFSELVREEARKSYKAEIANDNDSKATRKLPPRARSRKKRT